MKTGKNTMTKLTTLLVSISLLLGACSESSESTQTPTTSNSSSSQATTQGGSCLVDYQAEPWTLFSLEEVAVFVGLAANNGKMDEPIEMKNLSSRVAGYKWDTGRSMTTEFTGDMKIPVEDTVVIGRFDILDPTKINGSFVEHFSNQYRTLTEQEQSQFDAQFAKQLDNESEVAQDFAQGISNITKSINYHTITGIGNAAIWQTNLKSPDGLLNVLHKNTTFVVVTNLSDDRNYNKEIAKKIALAVIEKC